MLHGIDVDGLTFGRGQAADKPVADVRHIERHVQRDAALERDVPGMRAAAVRRLRHRRLHPVRVRQMDAAGAQIRTFEARNALIDRPVPPERGRPWGLGEQRIQTSG
jgi:hypothetical protein